MNFIDFKDKFFHLACFTNNQVYAIFPDFNRNNLVRWTQKSYIIKLRQGFYAFPEYLNKPGYNLYLANKIYKPSYISLHTALSFYGMIPETVLQITSVSTLKTKDFSNKFGTYSYKTVNTKLFFGYLPKTFNENINVLMASPEKALIDLLYLYPFYNSHEDFINLRLDEHFLENELNISLLIEIAAQTRYNVLNKRVNNLLKAYKI